MDIVQAVLLIVVGGGLALLAQFARKSRVALFGLLGLVALISLTLSGIGAWAVLVGRSGVIGALLPTRVEPTLAGAVFCIVGLIGIALCVAPLRGPGPAEPGAESPSTKGRFSRASWWSDPPVSFTLWASLVFLGYSLLALFAFDNGGAEAIQAEASAMGPFSYIDLLSLQLPSAIIALCGVGIGVRRGFRRSFTRLGYGPLGPAQLSIVALFVVGSVLLGNVAGVLFTVLQPETSEQARPIAETMFTPQSPGALAWVLFSVTMGFSAALGEETLFRGALQPAFGVVFAASLFTITHVHYGPGVLLVYLFVAGVGLGLLRKHINTSAAFLAHASLDSPVVLLAVILTAGAMLTRDALGFGGKIGE